MIKWRSELSTCVLSAKSRVKISPFFFSFGHMVSLSQSSPHVLLCSPRFRVIVEMMKPEKPDLSVTLKGLDYIDVLSGSKKDYKLNFFSHKEGLYSAKVSPCENPCPGTLEVWPWSHRSGIRKWRWPPTAILSFSCWADHFKWPGEGIQNPQSLYCKTRLQGQPAIVEAHAKPTRQQSYENP